MGINRAGGFLCKGTALSSPANLGPSTPTTGHPRRGFHANPTFSLIRTRKLICTSQEKEPVCPFDPEPEQGGGDMDKDTLPKGIRAPKASWWQRGALQNAAYPPQIYHPYSLLAQAAFW